MAWRKWRTHFLGCLRSRCVPLSNGPAVTSSFWGSGDLIFSLSPCKGVWPCTLCPLDDCPEGMRWQSGAKGVSRARLSFSCWHFTLHDNLKPPLNQRWGFLSPLPRGWDFIPAPLNMEWSPSSSLLSTLLSLQAFSCKAVWVFTQTAWAQLTPKPCSWASLWGCKCVV